MLPPGRLLPLLPLLAACSVGPNFKATNPLAPPTWFASRQNPGPAARKASVPVAQPIEARWWESFRDPVLTKLVTRAAASNLDVRAAAARLAQSRAQLRITGADAFPQVNGNGSYTRERQSTRGVLSLFGGSGSSSGQSLQTQSNGVGGRQGGVPASGTGGASGLSSPFDLWQYGFDASWELDLWGRVRRSIESADASLAASAEARRDTELSTMAEVARDYLQLRGAQETLRITEENLASARRTVELTRARARGGLSTDLDVANSEAQAETNASSIPQLQQQSAQLINAIALLLGEPPGTLEAELAARRPIPPVPPVVPVGLPSELARRRPDIRQAEAQLHAATASIGVAEADFYPRVTLSGSLAIQALQFKDLGNWASRTYGLGPAVTIPIFEGGRLRGTLALREAQQQEAALNYQRVVLGAFRDVDDALTAYAAEQRRHERLAASVTASRRALDLATVRYRQGVADYLQVLTAQRSLLGSQQQLADSTAVIGTNLVALYKALGGGWEAVPPETTASDARPGAGVAS